MFCVWLAFAVKIVVAMTAQLNLAWFTRYEPRKPHSDDVTAFSLTRTRAMLCLVDNSPKDFRQSDFCKNSFPTTKFRTHVEWNVSNTLKKESCDSAL